MNIILFDCLPDKITSKEDPEIFSHITKILKLREKDSFSMGLINQSEGKAVIKKITENSISFDYFPESKPSLYPVTLLVAQVRPICMKRILREAVSLGVERIILCSTDTGEKSYLSSNLYKTEEYKWYLKEGAMQSGHASLSDVLFSKDVQSAINSIKELQDSNITSFFVADNNCGSSVCLSKSLVRKNAVLAIGPERGWSDRERAVFKNSGFESVLLGSRILRTETACSVGLGLLLSRMNLL